MNKSQLYEIIKEMLGEETDEEERTPRDPEPTPEELKKMRSYVDMLGAEQAEKEADEAAWYNPDWKLEETQWGGFTGGAAPLDEPPLDSGPMSPEQQQKVFDILVDTGSDPEELKASGDFPDVIEENKMNIKQVIKEELQAMLEVDFDPYQQSSLGREENFGAMDSILNNAVNIEVLASRIRRSTDIFDGLPEGGKIAEALDSIISAAQSIKRESGGE